MKTFFAFDTADDLNDDVEKCGLAFKLPLGEDADLFY